MESSRGGEDEAQFCCLFGTQRLGVAGVKVGLQVAECPNCPGQLTVLQRADADSFNQIFHSPNPGFGTEAQFPQLLLDLERQQICGFRMLLTIGFYLLRQLPNQFKPPIATAEPAAHQVLGGQQVASPIQVVKPLEQPTSVHFTHHQSSDQGWLGLAAPAAALGQRCDDSSDFPIRSGHREDS